MKPESSIHQSENFTVLIPGAAGAWGTKICEAARSLGWNVLPHDPGKIDPPVVTDIRDAAAQADAVIICTPESEIPAILAEIRDRVHIIIEIATVKRALTPLEEELDAEGKSVCSTHPMVLADSNTSGHNVLLMPIGMNADRATDVATKLFTALGMRMQKTTVKEHNETIAPLTQLSPHLVQQTIAAALAEFQTSSGISPLDIIRNCGAANTFFTEWAMGRTLMSPKASTTSASIIIEGLKTEAGRKIVKSLGKAFKTILKAAKNGDVEFLASFLETSKKTLTPTGEWQDRMKTETNQILETQMSLRHKK